MSTQNNSAVFEDVLIFTGDEFIEKGFVVVEDGTIKTVGSGACSDDQLPAGISKISKPGYTLMPGLIDAHLHGLYGNELCIEESLRFGATTVCDMHNEPQHIHKLKELSNSNKSLYADFKCCGTGATVEGGWPTPVVLAHGATPQAKATIESWPKLQTPADAEWFVQHQVETAGASYIKIMHELGDCLNIPATLPHPPLETWKALVAAAHARGLKVVGHAFSAKGATELLECGVDGLTHIFFDRPSEPALEKIVQLCLKNKAHCNPTLTNAISHTGEGYDLQERFTRDPLAQRMLTDKRPRGLLGLAAKGSRIETAYDNTKALYHAGVPLMVGSDSSGQPKGQAYGLTVHMEIWQMVHKTGMSVEEVLRAATSLTADRFGFDDRGRIAAGKKADLILVEGDVREVILDPQSLCLPLRAVWRDGVLAAVYR